MPVRTGTAGGRRRRPRRSREEVSEALIDAAVALFAERPSGRVTVRDIAARADVNPAFVNRYFGSKRNLMRAAVERAEARVAARIDDMPDVVSGAPEVFHAALQERELTATLARAILDGHLDDVPLVSPAASRLLERFLCEAEAGGRRGRHDTRVVVACLTAATMGYALFGRYIRQGTGLYETPEDQVEASLVQVLQDVARAALAAAVADDATLPSWNDGPARAAILGFVRSVTTPGDTFVPPAERLATFDNDGTLWCEKPLYVQADFVLRRFREMVRDDPEKAKEQPYKAIAEGDTAWLADVYAHVPELIKGVTEAYSGLTTEAFDEAARAFFASAVHPTLGVPYTQVAYRPMCELIRLLERHEFKVYICSAGGRDFVRAVCEQVYGLPRERVIGSATTLEYRDGDLYRARDVEQPIADGPGKPVHIWTRTGRRPLLAGGNADGDVPMLETARFALLVRHDDEEREFAYDEGGERALAAARARGWTVVSMKEDFKKVF